MDRVIDNIRVAAVHGPGSRICPVWFDLECKQHRIQEITNIWCERRGAMTKIYFHVTDGGALYELVYTPSETLWQLQRVEAL